MNFKKEITRLELDLSATFFDDCSSYISYLKEWNEVHSLTNFKDDEAIYEQIFDSIYPMKFLPNINSILDIGTGAGFPGLIIGFAFRDIKVFLSESNGKKASFLNFVKVQLNLDNVEVLSQRVETIDDLNVDLITSRAVKDMQTIMKFCKNQLHDKSTILLFKGQNVDSEMDFSEDYDIELIPRGKKRNYLFIRMLK